VSFLAHLLRRLKSPIGGLGQAASLPKPAYAPELNPVEYLWGYWKHHQLPKVCAKDLWHLNDRARQTLRCFRRRPRLITAFWKQTSLFV